MFFLSNNKMGGHSVMRLQHHGGRSLRLSGLTDNDGSDYQLTKLTRALERALS